MAQLGARVVWEHRQCSHRTKAKIAESPSTVRISGGLENKNSGQKCVWPQIWPLTRPQFNNYRGVAQLIARRIWDAEAASLSLATPTNILTESRVYSPPSVIFYAYLGISPPLLKNAFLRPHKQIWTGNFFFFAYSGAEFEKSNEQPPRIFPWRYCIHLTPSVRIWVVLSRRRSAAYCRWYEYICSTLFLRIYVLWL